MLPSLRFKEYYNMWGRHQFRLIRDEFGNIIKITTQDLKINNLINKDQSGNIVKITTQDLKISNLINK